LRPLPRYRFVDYDIEHLKVRRTSTIEVRKVVYSVPPTLIGRQVTVRIHHDRLQILLGRTLAERAEVRRLVGWFDQKFFHEVTRNLLHEKQMKRDLGRGNPDAAAIRAGYANLKPHMDYLGWLAETRAWLAGSSFSMADLAAAAQLSALDYIGDVDWALNDATKEWYARIKSRPSFRPLLADRISGLAPPAHYDDLDF
jgi:glutathione S-transferase